MALYTSYFSAPLTALQASLTEEGEAKRDDKNCFYVSCWEYQGEDKDPVKYTEPLKYEAIEVKTRNYKN